MKIKTAARHTMQIIQEHHKDAQPLRNTDDPVSINHAFWLLMGISAGYVENEKAHRWLGWAQCTIVITGMATLSDMKQINKDA